MQAQTEERTIRLYDRDAYAHSFEAAVTACERADEGKPLPQKKEALEAAKTGLFRVLLDQTLFFPEEGGQSPDRGTLDGQEVLDVQTLDGYIWHFVTLEIPEGRTVQGEVDFDYRFSNMQQHTGEHIFSGLVHSRFGYDNVGFHLSDREVTLDFNGVLSAEEAAEIEREANRVITSNRKISAIYPTQEEARGMDYRSKIEIEDQLRLIEIPGVDLCACCAPHVKRTGEVGFLKVTALQNYKGGVRVHILCGSRAAAQMAFEHDRLTEISNYLTTSKEESFEAVKRLKEEVMALRAEKRKLLEAQLQEAVRGLPDGLKDVCLFTEGADKNAMQEAVNAMVLRFDGYCGVFAGNDAEGYQYVIGIRDGNANEMNARLRAELGARGGGKPAMVQGMVSAAAERIRQFFEN